MGRTARSRHVTGTVNLGERPQRLLEVVAGTADTIKPTESKPVLNPRLQRRWFSFISKE